MYCYVNCIPDIIYCVTILSKSSSTSSYYHYSCLENLTRYLRINRDLGIIYKRIVPRLDPPDLKHHPILLDENIPKPKQDIYKG